MIYQSITTLTIILSMIIYLFITMDNNMIWVRANNQHEYLVNDIEGNQKVANHIGEIHEILKKFVYNIYNDRFKYSQYEQYIVRLHKRFPSTQLMENPALRPDKSLTSYSLNKGEKIVFCVRNPNDIQQLYDQNNSH